MGDTWTLVCSVKPTREGIDGFDPTPGDVLIYHHSHKHAWQPHGVHTWPSGRTCPVYRCHTCGDIASDMSQGYGGTDPDTGRPNHDTRTPKEDRRG
ncbi:hypothetical protein [Sanguibacter massiliensis]|uniref:hypothetical protein n=1 Tax=Sanguibacter massiliensis TaxID=1973217 RepID=UPI000C8470B2|nr:hypothetical protein [Sanguibacter massiliensis]